MGRVADGHIEAVGDHLVLCSLSCKPDTVLGTGDTARHKPDKNPFPRGADHLLLTSK